MSLMVIPNEGKLLWLYWALKTAGGDLENYTLDLYQNNYTPVDGSTAANFTVATFPGYNQLALTRANFGATAIVANIATSQYATVPTFVCSGGGGQLVYGWYMRGATSGKVLAAQEFATPRNMTNGATEELDPFIISLDTFQS